KGEQKVAGQRRAHQEDRGAPKQGKRATNATRERRWAGARLGRAWSDERREPAMRAWPLRKARPVARAICLASAQLLATMSLRMAVPFESAPVLLRTLDA